MRTNFYAPDDRRTVQNWSRSVRHRVIVAAPRCCYKHTRGYRSNMLLDHAVAALVPHRCISRRIMRRKMRQQFC